MFLHRLERLVQEYEANIQDDHMRVKEAKAVSQALTEKASEMPAVTPYRTIRRDEPPTLCPLRSPQYRASAQAHALVRADVKDDRHGAAEQSIPSYNGFHVGLNMEQGKSKACFHIYSQPPNKSVVKDIMDQLTITIATKRMPFAFLVGDHPVDVLSTLLKAENPNKYRDIVPFHGPFNTQCVMMSAIYKRYKGSNLGEVLVAGGVIAGGSVDRALNGKHYMRSLRCSRLMYKALMSQLVKGKLTSDLADETRENLQIL